MVGFLTKRKSWLLSTTINSVETTAVDDNRFLRQIMKSDIKEGKKKKTLQDWLWILLTEKELIFLFIFLLQKKNKQNKLLSVIFQRRSCWDCFCSCMSQYAFFFFFSHHYSSQSILQPASGA